MNSDPTTKPSILFHPHFNRYIVGIVVAAVAISGIYLAFNTYASSNSAYIQPAAITAALGTDVVVPVRINTNADPVNAVEMHLTYPASKLQFVSLDAATGSFPLIVQSSGDNSAVTIIAATQGGAPTVVGDLLVANITFHTIATGTASIGMVNTSVALSSLDSSNVLASYTGGTITIPKAHGRKH